MVSDGLSGGEITGIVFGVLIGAAVLGVGGYFGLMYYQRRQLPSLPNMAFSNNTYQDMDNLPNNDYETST